MGRRRHAGDGFRYREYAPEARDRVWMSAGFAFGQVVARAFAQSAWPGDIRGADLDRIGGGLVTDMPVEPFRTDPDGVWLRKSVEIIWNDRQERELLDAGLIRWRRFRIPTNWCSARRAARWCRSASPDRTPTRPMPTRDCPIRSTPSCVPPASPTTSRCWAGQMVGSFKTAEEIESVLDGWIKGYVRSNAPYEIRARYPLIAGKVSVHELTGKPGSFGCTVFLQPHYQIDDVAASFQLVTDLGGR